MWKHVYTGKPPGTICAKDDAVGIDQQFRTHGFAIVQVLTLDECKLHVLNIWKQVILQQPWSDEHRLVITDKDGRVLDPANPAHADEFYAQVTGVLDAKTRERFKRGWTMHRQFGACCDPKAYHDQMTWDLRMRADLCGIINQLYGHTKWRAHVERPVALLPTEGHGIGPHVDQATSAAIARAARRDDSHTVLQVKMAFTWSSICVAAGTHSHGFWDLVPAHYADELDLKSKRPKNGLPKNGKDPLGIAALMVKYALPPGCVVFFDPSLWHTHGKLSAADAVVYARYLGTTTCMEQVDDVLRSFREGNAPKTHPSGDPVHYVPLKYFNFPAHMWAKILMLFAVFRFQGPLRPGEERVELHPMVQRSKTGKKDLFIVALPNYGHVCPTLTRLGLRILVGEERMEQMRLSGEWDGGDTWTCEALVGASGSAPAKRQTGGASAPLSEVMQGKQPADADDSDDAGPARAGWKRKRLDALDSSDEDEPAAARADDGGAAADASVGGAAADASVGGAAADDSDDEVIFVRRVVAPDVVDLTGDD